MKHVIRTRDGNTKKVDYSRALAIKALCTECLGWEVHPRDCQSKMCPVYPFRGQTMATQKGDGK